MNVCTVTRVVMCAALVTGCVSSGTHEETVTELEEARKSAAQTAAAFESFKKQTAAEADSLRNQLADVNARIASLMSGTTTAQEEIARLQKRAGELEAETARANDLAKQLSGREQDLNERLKTEAAEKARLEKERAAKEAEIQRLTQTHAELTKSLEAEIAKGDIKIKQVRDRLTINMVDRVLFDSGQSQVKPAGLQVLKQVSDILKKVTDKQIRIEGHTDNVPIGVKLRGRFPTNWELSTARATSVVRYLIEDGGVDRANLLAVGYADTRPLVANDTEEGRTANRRIEIALYPKDLSEIASQLKP